MIQWMGGRGASGGRRLVVGWVLVALSALALVLSGCGVEKAETLEDSVTGAREQRAEAARPAGASPKPDPAATRKSPLAAMTRPTGPGSSKTSQRTAWVFMKQKPNLAPARNIRDWKAKGQAVYQSLTSTAATSQANLRTYLKSKGLNHRPFWIANAVRVIADDATFAEIGRRSDVARIVPDQGFSIPRPIKHGSGTRVTAAEWGLDSIRAPQVWADYGAMGEGIVVANIDTGVDYTHPALVEQYRGSVAGGGFDHEYNWFDPANVCGGVPCDNVAHGTHTMGTMVGDDHAGNQIGVAPSAQWIAAKGCEDFYCSYESLLAAGEWILAPTDRNGNNPRPDLRPHIVNNSWGGGSSDFYMPIVDAWVAAQIFPAFAAGNGNPSCGSISSPGDYPASYAVGAFDSLGSIADFSLLGPSSFGPIKPNIAAPGVFVRSSVPGADYDYFDGTSMATPHLAGTVALLWSASPELHRDIDATRAIVDQSAIDTAGLSCGGTAENNNVWGEGKLDALAAMGLAPIGPSGTLTGFLTNQEGAPIAGARILVSGGDLSRQSSSRSDGSYSFRLPVGTYDLTASAFGYLTQVVSGVAVSEENVTLQNVTLESAPSHSVSGVVRDTEGTAIENVTLTLVGTPIPPTQSGSGGFYSFPSVPEGTYELQVEAGGCFAGASATLVVDSDLVKDFALTQREDGYGYRCNLSASSGAAGDTLLGVVGDDDSALVQLPFPFTYYGQTYQELNVSTNGSLSFTSSYPNFWNETIPSPSDPNAAIFPFWDDLYVDGANGNIYTAVRGAAPKRSFVIEWRNVSPLQAPEQVVSFSVILSETGGIVFEYADAEPDPLQRGASASIGIEDASGVTGLQYSFDQPVLRSGLAIEFTLPPSGLVRGLVTDRNSGSPVAGATVEFTAQGELIRSGKTGSDGRYQVQVPVGTYAVRATKKGFSVETTNITIAENQVLVRDFSLASGLATLDPATLQLIVGPGEARTRTFKLTNAGSLAFDFTTRESGGARQAMQATRLLKRNPLFDLGAATTRNLFSTSSRGGMAPTAAGDVLASWPATGVSLAWGVGVTDNVWLGDFFDDRDTEFTPIGALTGRAWPAPGAGSTAADMAYDSVRNLLCQVDVSGDNGIHCLDPDTGAERASLFGSWTAVSQRGLAYRPDDDSFYVGGWNEGIIYHISGLSSDSPGQVISSCSPVDGEISGLGWNMASRVLWEATNSWTDSIYQLNPEDCTVLSTIAHPTPGGYLGAGLDVDLEGNLWTVSQGTNSAYLVESGLPNFNDVPWLSVSPTSGTLKPGKSKNLEVTVDTSGLTTGQYFATVFIETNTPKEPILRIPVTVIVTDYLQAIEVGGKEYTDASGDTWVTDKKYTKQRTWGYIEEGSTLTTSHKISGTDDPALFQTQRIDPYAYRFDGVPSGIYEVQFRFAELEKLKPNKRLFDVIVEDTTVLPAHDIAYEVGKFAAETRTFFVEVSDGRLDVRLIARKGYDKPVLNALRVIHRVDR